LAVTLGLFGTGIGLILATFLVALSMDAELREGGLKTLMLRESRRNRLFVAKLVGSYGALSVSLLLCLVAMVVFNRLLEIFNPIPVASAGWGSLGLPSWPLLLLAALVTPLFGVAVALFGSLLLSSSLGGIGSVLLGLALDRAVGILSPHAAKFTVEGAIASLTQGAASSSISQAQVTFHIWPAFVGSSESAAIAIVIVMATTGVVLASGRQILLVREYR